MKIPRRCRLVPSTRGDRSWFAFDYPSSPGRMWTRFQSQPKVSVGVFGDQFHPPIDEVPDDGVGVIAADDIVTFPFALLAVENGGFQNHNPGPVGSKTLSPLIVSFQCMRGQ